MLVRPSTTILSSLAAAFLVLHAGLARAQPSDESAERARFVGVWQGFAVHGRGERPNEGPVQLELTITEQTIRGIQIRGSDRMDHGQGEYVLRLGADPKHLDAAKTAERGRTQAYVGIYRLEGDTLYWCVSPQKQRPKTFETQKGQFLLILHRDPPERR